jgi:hypothetical protein
MFAVATGCAVYIKLELNKVGACEAELSRAPPYVTVLLPLHHHF